MTPDMIRDLTQWQMVWLRDRTLAYGIPISVPLHSNVFMDERDLHPETQRTFQRHQRYWHRRTARFIARVTAERMRYLYPDAPV